MGAVVGLVGGLGLFFLWWSTWPVAAVKADAATLRSLGKMLARSRQTLVQAGLPESRLVLVAVSCPGIFVVGLLVVGSLTGSPALAVMFALPWAALPPALVRRRARKRRAELSRAWPDVVDHLTSGIRAGLSLSEAIAQVGERGPVAVQPEFRAFAADFRATGQFVPCLERLRHRLADPVADQVFVALRLTREVGGCDVGTLLRSVSSFLRNDARIRGELQARQSWTVNAARVAVVAPWLVLAMFATRPESLQAYNTTAGVVVLVVGATVTMAAYWMMIRIGRLPTEQRVLQ